MKIVNNTHVSHCIFSYDVLPQLSHIRLVCADGNWQGNNTLHYETFLEYEKNGRISRKVLYADTWLDGNYTPESYTNDYHYNSSYPNTLAYIDNSGHQDFAWDRKGNMVFHHNDHSGYDRRLCWDEQNRLQGVADYGRQFSYYQYDAGGERTYKFTGGYAAQNIQGHWWTYHLLNSPTLYASPYVVATPQGYTKHYYAGNERIASRIGGGGLADIAQTVVNMEDLSEDVWVGELPLIWDEGMILEYYKNRLYESRSHLTDVMMCAGENPLVEENRLEELRTYWRYVQDEGEPLCYWYHPDHLGSSSWITEKSGHSVQHLHYLPWGEDFVDQRTSSWSALHTFSAKERDAETGLSYFGARYYSSDLSIWLSIDPQAAKYPSLSPYVYCADNPVKLVDPNGEEMDDIFVNTKTKQVSIIKTNDTYDRVIVDGTYTGNREKGLETSERVQQGYNVNTMNIRYASSSMSKISDYSMSVLIDVMNESENYSATITSTTRTPEDQVRILCQNIQNKGFDNQRKLYANPGKQVIDLYPNQDAMLAKIYELGPQTISKHCADPSVLNVFDVAPSSISNKNDFHIALEKNAQIHKCLTPYNSNDPAFHIEIKQQTPVKQPKCILK